MCPDPIFGFIYPYGLMIGIGLAVCFLLFWFFCDRLQFEKKYTNFITIDAVVSIAFGFFCAALTQSIYNYIENPSAGFKFGTSINFLGGLLGGAVFFLIIYFIFRKKFTNHFLEFIAIAPVCITVAHGFGRIGCFLSGCCYGIETDSFLGVQFPHLAHKVLPTNLFEAIFLFVLFGVLLLLTLKNKYRYNMPIYLIGYGVWRFVIEFFRGDHRGELITGLSPAQFWSLLLIVGGISLLIYYIVYYKKKNKITEIKK